MYANLTLIGPSYCFVLALTLGLKSRPVTPTPVHLPTLPLGKILFKVNAGELEQTVSGTSICIIGKPFTKISVLSVTGQPLDTSVNLTMY